MTKPAIAMEGRSPGVSALPPDAQMIAGPNRDNPIKSMAVPVTTGAKICAMRENSGAMKMPSTPDTRVAPKMPGRPRAGLEAMAMLGPMATKVTPMTIGRRTPTPKIPKHWIRVIRPHASRSELMR